MTSDSDSNTNKHRNTNSYCLPRPSSLFSLHSVSPLSFLPLSLSVSLCTVGGRQRKPHGWAVGVRRDERQNEIPTVTPETVKPAVHRTSEGLLCTRVRERGPELCFALSCCSRCQVSKNTPKKCHSKLQRSGYEKMHRNFPFDVTKIKHAVLYLCVFDSVRGQIKSSIILNPEKHSYTTNSYKKCKIKY